MKTAYELAMERLNKTLAAVKLTTGQKRKLAGLDSKYAAKIAEREIALQDEMNKVTGSGDLETLEQLRQQLARERKALQNELDDKKGEIRKGRA
jgi:hypothetical protein